MFTDEWKPVAVVEAPAMDEGDGIIEELLTALVRVPSHEGQV